MYAFNNASESPDFREEDTFALSPEAEAAFQTWNPGMDKKVCLNVGTIPLLHVVRQFIFKKSSFYV